MIIKEHRGLRWAALLLVLACCGVFPLWRSVSPAYATSCGAGGTCYWVGGAGTWDGSTTTNWSSTDGGAGGAGVPDNAATVLFTSNSGTGTVTIAAGAAFLNVTMVGKPGGLTFAGTATITLNATSTWQDADWTGFGGTITGTSRVVRFNTVSGSLVTLGSTMTLSVLELIPDRSTTFTQNGATVTLHTASGLMIANSGSITLTLGSNLVLGGTAGNGGISFPNNNSPETINLAGFNLTTDHVLISNTGTNTISNGGVITLTGTGTVWDNSGNHTVTLSGTAVTITLSDASGTAKTFSGGGQTYDTVNLIGGGSGSFTFASASSFSTMVETGGPYTVILSSTPTVRSGGAFFGAPTGPVTLAAGTYTVPLVAPTVTTPTSTAQTIDKDGHITFTGGGDVTATGGDPNALTKAVQYDAAGTYGFSATAETTAGTGVYADAVTDNTHAFLPTDTITLRAAATNLAPLTGVSGTNTTWTALVTAPTMTVSAPTNLHYDGTGSHATLNGNIANLGSATSIFWEFQCGSDTNYGITTAPVAASATGAITANCDGFAASQPLHSRSVAVINGVVVAVSADNVGAVLGSPAWVGLAHLIPFLTFVVLVMFLLGLVSFTTFLVVHNSLPIMQAGIAIMVVLVVGTVGIIFTAPLISSIIGDLLPLVNGG